MLNTKELTDKQTEQTTLGTESGKIETEYMAMGPLQDLITKEKEYREQIEEMNVELASKEVTIKKMEDGTEFLDHKKDELDERKKQTDQELEDLERQLKAKEEANQKRLIAKLTRDKNPLIKELIANEENQKEANEQFQHKLREETEKHT